MSQPGDPAGDAAEQPVRGRWSERAGLRREALVRDHRWRQLVDKQPDVAEPATRLTFGDRSVLNFGGNDYLGLAHDPAVLAAAARALAVNGAGAGGSRLLSGQRPLHAALEAALARLKNKPRALVFPSGYQAAVTLLATLCALDAAPPRLLLDKLCHASLIDGASLGGAKFQRFKHNQPEDLDKYLHRHPPGSCVVVVESIYSMDGDSAPLVEIHACCRKFAAVLVIDDAHATGLLGLGGSGLTQPFAADENVIVLGTLSKALGSQGGFIAAHDWVVEELVQQGRGFLFSTGLAPACAGAALAAVERLPAMDAAREHLHRLRRQLVAALPNDVATEPSTGSALAAAVVPVVLGADARAVAVADALLADGFYVPAVRPPTVPPGTARLRISLSAAHRESDVAALIAALHRRLA